MRPNRILLLLLAATLFSCNKETNKELPTVSINSLEVSEGNVDNTIYVNFLLSREFDEPVTLIVSTKDGMAEAGEDYLVVQDQTLVFAPFDLAESL